MTFASLVCGKTGSELMLKDELDIKETLLYKMAIESSPEKQILKRFECWNIACLSGDIPVGYTSSSLNPCIPLFNRNTNQPSFLIHSIERNSDPLSNSLETIISSYHSESNPIIIHEKNSKAYPETFNFMVDSINECEYSPEMLNQLLSSTHHWNTITIDLHIPQFMYRPFTHALCNGKYLWFLPKSVVDTSKQAIELICKLVDIGFKEKRTRKQ